MIKTSALSQWPIAMLQKQDSDFQKDLTATSWKLYFQLFYTSVAPWRLLTHLQVDVLQPKHLELADGEEWEANAHAVPQRSHHGKPQHRAHILEQGLRGHEVATVQRDGWQHVEEEDVGAEHDRWFLLHRVHNPTTSSSPAHGDEQTRLGDPDGDLLVDVEAYTRERNHRHQVESEQAVLTSISLSDEFSIWLPRFVLKYLYLLVTFMLKSV